MGWNVFSGEIQKDACIRKRDGQQHANSAQSREYVRALIASACANESHERSRICFDNTLY